MRRTLLLMALVIVIAAGLLIGCQAETDGQGPDTDGQDVEISLAPIHEVQAIFAESFPVQVFVYIKGGLADGATTFHETKVERSGNTITITVTTQRPKDAVATQVYGYFEENVALGIDFTSGETYIVIVNDQTTSFVMQ